MPPTNGWLLMDVLGRFITNKRIWSGNRDDTVIGVFALSHCEPYNVYEIVSEYTLCAQISSLMRS